MEFYFSKPNIANNSIEISQR